MRIDPEDLIAAAEAMPAETPAEQQLHRWQDLCTNFPSYPAATAGLAVCLRRLERFDAAEPILVAARARFPGNLAIAVAHAANAADRGDWAAALARADILCADFRDEAEGFRIRIRAARSLGRNEEAEAIAHTAMSYFPGKAPFSIAYAGLAGARQDWPEALSRWHAVIEHYPSLSDGYAGAAEALNALGRHAEAWSLLEAARPNLAPTQALLLATGYAANGLGDPAKIEAAWAELRAKFPNNRAGWLACADALHKIGLTSRAQALLLEGRSRFPDLRREPGARPGQDKKPGRVGGKGPAGQAKPAAKGKPAPGAGAGAPRTPQKPG